MTFPAWMVALAMVYAFASEVSAQCWENPRCRDLSSDESILECLRLCKSEVAAGQHVGDSTEEQAEEGGPSFLLPALSPAEEGPGAEPEGREPRREEKRSYSMEHFRWGKPVGRKRRPIKVFPNGVEEESAEAYPAETRRELAVDYASEDGDLALEHPQFTLLAKKDGSYKMNHFRWSGPPASKRYGGFMKSWGERSQKPLLTLLKNVIIKDGQ